MSAITLRLAHVFGLKGDVKDNLHYIDETHVLYPAGYNIVSFDVASERKQQKFFPLNSPGAFEFQQTGDISAIAVSANSLKSKSKCLAVAERGGHGRASITVYDLATFKKRTKAGAPIESKELSSKEFVSMCFSPDGKFLLTQGGAPDWTLINWQWDKARPLQIAKVSNKAGAPIHQCSYCPTDPTVVCVTGNGILRFLHVDQSEFKAIPFSMGKREPQNYLCHTWVDDRILVGTDTGDILVFENAEFRGVLESSPSDGKSIDSIAAFSRGFVCGCDDGVLYVFERHDKEIYKQAKSFQIDGNFVKIKNIAVSPTEDFVACTLENNQAFVLGLSHTDILKTEEMNFDNLALPFHYMGVTGLDVCTRKPLVVTCGVDRSVRIWNYDTKSIEVMRFFNEQPHSCAFHPSGLHILVGFTDSLRLINLLMDELKPYQDFTHIKSCRECRFSNGGQMFAAVNGSLIQVYNTYTCELVQSFNAHKGKVRSLDWLQDDSGIVSAGLDGCVYNWAVKDGKHNLPSKQKCNYSCARAVHNGLLNSGGSEIYAVGSDKHLKVIKDGELAENIPVNFVLTQLELLCPPNPHPKMLFAASETGVVRVYPLPLDGKFYDQQIHHGSIKRMRISSDDNYLFTVGEDGCLSMFNIDQKRRDGRGPRVEQALPWAEEILVTKSDLEEKMALMNDLQNKVEELQNHNSLQIQLREATYRDKLREVTEKFHTELDVDKQRYRALEEEKKELEKKYAFKVDKLNETQGAKLNELNDHHTKKLQAEELRYSELEKKMKLTHERWNEQKRGLDEEYAHEKEQLKEEFEFKLKQETENLQRIDSEKAEVMEQFEVTKTLMESDADREIDELKASYDKKLTLERMATLRLKDQNAILKRKFGALRDDINDNLDELQKMREKQIGLYANIDTLEKDIKGQVKEIKERESTIDDKVHRIFELRKKNQELEKFKFVLDYKITELKRQIRPREDEMEVMQEQITQMQSELRGYKKESAHLMLKVKELNLKYNGMEKEIGLRRKDRDDVDQHLRQFKTELHEVYLNLEDPKLLKDGIKRLYQRHVTSELNTQKTGVDDMHKDYQRQRKYLERSVDSLNEKLKKDMRVHKKDNMRIMQENIALIKEINQLRREIKIMRSQQKLKDSQKRASRRKQDTQPTGAAKRRMIEREMEEQQEQIRALTNQLAILRQEIEASSHRPSSQQRLPQLAP